MVGDLITSSARFLITQFPPAIQYCNVVVIMVDKWSDALPFTFFVWTCHDLGTMEIETES